MNRPIFLWGYMGAGKTRLGKRLAQYLNIEFFDLDQVIEERMNLIVSEIFNQFGEAYFRQLESEIVEEFAQKKDIVLSCGGGTPCFHQNKSIMVNHGLVLYLEVEHDILVERLWNNRTQRPLIARMENQEQLSSYIQKHLSERLPYYSHAHVKHDNTYPWSGVEELVDFIKGELEKPNHE